jgi:hypothetical protein
MDKLSFVFLSIFLTACVTTSIKESEEITLNNEGLLLVGVKMDGVSHNPFAGGAFLDFHLDKFDSPLAKGMQQSDIRAFGPYDLIFIKLKPGLYSVGGAGWMKGPSLFTTDFDCMPFFEIKPNQITYAGSLYIGQQDLSVGFFYNTVDFKYGLFDEKNIMEKASSKYPQAFQNYTYVNESKTKGRCGHDGI